MSAPRYIESESAWLLPDPTGSGIEIVVSGTALEPELLRLERVTHALSRLSDLKIAAISHLNEYVDCKRLADGGDWFLEGLTAREPAEPDTMVAVHFSIEGDTYGYWTVKLKFALDRYHATELSRRQV